MLFFSILNISAQNPVITIKNESRDGKKNGSIKVEFQKLEKPLIYTVIKLGKIIQRDTIRMNEFEIINITKGKYYLYYYFENNEDSVIDYKLNPIILK